MTIENKLWVARDKDGLLVLFRGKPVRDNDYKEWCTSDYCEKHYGSGAYCD